MPIRPTLQYLAALPLVVLSIASAGCPTEAAQAPDVVAADASDTSAVDGQNDGTFPDAVGDSGVDGSAPDAVPPAVPEALAQALEAIVADSHKDVEAPGLVVGVRLGDGRWWASGSGEADRDGDEFATPAHAFGIGSITKSMTATVILQLVQEGSVELDAAIDTLVPGFDLGSEITVRAALTHSSGVFNFTDDNLFLAKSTEFWLPLDIVAWALDHGPAFPPQTDYGYSNTNFYLLGLVIQAVTGKPYHEAVRERVFGPVGLSRTYIQQFEEGDGGPVATGYVVESDVTGAMDLSWSWAAGAGVSTVADLCRWGDQLLFGDVLGPAMRTVMTTPHQLPSGSETPYGMGVVFSQRGPVGAKLPLMGHTGSTMGFKAEWFFHPPSKTCVVVLTNNFLSTPSKVSNPVWGLLASEGFLQ